MKLVKQAKKTVITWHITFAKGIQGGISCYALKCKLFGDLVRVLWPPTWARLSTLAHTELVTRATEHNLGESLEEQVGNVLKELEQQHYHTASSDLANSFDHCMWPAMKARIEAHFSSLVQGVGLDLEIACSTACSLMKAYSLQRTGHAPLTKIIRIHDEGLDAITVSSYFDPTVPLESLDSVPT